MLKRTSLALFSLIAAMTLFDPSAKAQAGNTNFLTERNGAVTFPFSPPNRASSLPATIDNTTIGATTPAAGTFTTLRNTGLASYSQVAPDAEIGTITLTAAAVTNGIINGTPVAAAAYTLPLATAMDTALPASVANDSFVFSVINTSGGANTITMTTNTGWTLVGTMTVAQNVSGRFLARKTGTGAWVLYRLS